MIEYENLKKLNGPFEDAYRERFESVLKSGWYILGNEVKAFEESFAAYCGNRHCVGVANGLDALVIALKAFEFPEGSEVIVPSNTYIATILSILNANLKPVLVEPDFATCNIDPKKIDEAVTDQTVAVMVVHLYGKCCEMDPILRICQSRNLKLIEDCAQAHGAKYKGKMAGTFGDFGAFSFYPTKNLGALGDGGSLNTNDDELARTVRRFRNYGSDKKYYNEIIGMNSRLDEMQAAFLNVKLKHLDDINKKKRRLAKIYDSGLKDDFMKPVVASDFHDVYHIYNIRHPRRDDLRSYLEKNDIKTEIHYPVSPNHQKAMANIFEKEAFPISQEIHATTLSLPISYFHDENDIERVVDVMNRF